MVVPHIQHETEGIGLHEITGPLQLEKFIQVEVLMMN